MVVKNAIHHHAMYSSSIFRILNKNTKFSDPLALISLQMIETCKNNFFGYLSSALSGPMDARSGALQLPPILRSFKPFKMYNFAKHVKQPAMSKIKTYVEILGSRLIEIIYVCKLSSRYEDHLHQH